MRVEPDHERLLEHAKCWRPCPPRDLQAADIIGPERDVQRVNINDTVELKEIVVVAPLHEFLVADDIVD